jgi:hypothetical protein
MLPALFARHADQDAKGPAPSPRPAERRSGYKNTGRSSRSVSMVCNMAAVCGEFGGDNPRFGPLSKIRGGEMLDGQILDGNGRRNSQGYSCYLAVVIFRTGRKI